MAEGVTQHTKSVEQNPYDQNQNQATEGDYPSGQHTSAAFVESVADAPREQFMSIQTGPQITVGEAQSSSYALPQVVRSDSPVFRDELSNTVPLSNFNSSTLQGGLSPRRVVPAHGQSNAPFMIRQQKLQQAQEFINQLQSADMKNQHRPIPWRQNGGGSVTQKLGVPLNHQVSRQTALKKTFATGGGSYSQRRYIPVARTLVGGALRSSNK